MYIELVRQVIETDVETYADRYGLSVPEVLSRIREHIDRTSSEHRTDEPGIDYEDALCRLGYLFRHAPANATIFEHVLNTSDKLSLKQLYADPWVLNVCAVGGGPGTELLGIAKYLLRRPHLMPRKITFTVLDNVPHWAETWQHLADVIEVRLTSSLANEEIQVPAIAPSFLPLDVFDEGSYGSYTYQFGQTHVVVFNYLFSENKNRLKEARLAIERIAKLTPPGCAFVVIDRLEGTGSFKGDIIALFESIFGKTIEVGTYDGTLGPDEEKSDMGEDLTQALGNPRIKFFTDYLRKPTVFWLVAKKGES